MASLINSLLIFEAFELQKNVADPMISETWQASRRILEILGRPIPLHDMTQVCYSTDSRIVKNFQDYTTHSEVAKLQLLQKFSVL